MNPQEPISARLDLGIRQRLLEEALRRLASEGLSADLLERAAHAVGCTAERARLFFQRDEEVVLAAYSQFASELEEQMLDLPEGTVTQRFAHVMQAKFRVVAPYRAAMRALHSTLLNPDHELGVLHPQTELIRSRVLGIFSVVVQGAIDAPADDGAEFAALLYAVHLGLLWVWSRDGGQRRSSAALILIGRALRWAPFRRAGLWAARLSWPKAWLRKPKEPAIERRAEQILRCLYQYRRILPEGHSLSCASEPCLQCLALHLPRVKYFLRAGQPLHLVLPAFPAKSPSRRKTLGVLPDEAERQALANLQAMCDQLRALHEPGARLTICSDGHVFSDLVNVSDENVTRYGEEIRAMIQRFPFQSLDLFNLGDLYPGQDFEAMRAHLLNQYARPLEQILARAQRFAHAQAQINGIQRFLFEEQADLEQFPSRTQLRKACEKLAVLVVQRSEAWGRLVAGCFPTAIRLSIHPQHPHSEKIGILLGPASNVWLTPWHGVALRHAQGWKLVKRSEAEALGAELIEQDGRPSHFHLDPSL